jgi:hypothetical protein
VGSPPEQAEQQAIPRPGWGGPPDAVLTAGITPMPRWDGRNPLRRIKALKAYLEDWNMASDCDRDRFLFDAPPELAERYREAFDPVIDCVSAADRELDGLLRIYGRRYRRELRDLMAKSTAAMVAQRGINAVDSHVLRDAYQLYQAACVPGAGAAPAPARARGAGRPRARTRRARRVQRATAGADPPPPEPGEPAAAIPADGGWSR